MKHILASLVLTVLLFPALALGETMKDLVERDGLYYKKFPGVPFTGTVTGITQGVFRNGKKEGPWVNYHENEQVDAKGTYKDGKADGPWVYYYENGQLRSKGTFKDGKQDGTWIHYYENGQLLEKGTYKDGKAVGPWVSYHDNGQLWQKRNFKDDKKVGPWVSYLSDGSAEPSTVTIDWLEGTYTGEVSNGVPHGQGTWTHPNGNKYVGEWKDGKPWNGTMYDKDQNVIGTYSDGAWKEN